MKKALMVFLLLIIGASTLVISIASSQDETGTFISNESWKIGYDQRGITHLSSKSDPYKVNVISRIIDANVRFRIGGGDWQPIDSSRKMEVNGNIVRFINNKQGNPFSMEQTFTLKDEVLDWDIVLENNTSQTIDIGDISISIPFRSNSGREPVNLFEKGYLRHFFVSGDGSFIFLNKRSGQPPYLMITVKPGTSLEYFQRNDYFIHSGYSGNKQAGNWRHEHTYAALAPEGQKNDRLTYGFRLQWADSYDELRDILYKNKLMDFRVVPGMTVPEDLEARFSLHSKALIDSIVPEFPGQTKVTYLGEPKPDNHIYKVKFDRLGENMLIVHFDSGRKTYLEFFITEPVETLLKKRTSFIVDNQQHRNPDLWYNGLFSVWDMTNSVLRGPDNTDGNNGWNSYRVASDDPVLGIAAFLASVNAIYPDDHQIWALEYHIKNHVWGGLQRTDKESYPYGIMGVPNYKVARDTTLRLQIEDRRRINITKIWRSYDYPHVFMMYYHMYQIAERYPDKVKYLDADGYLERMWQTARAFFQWPYEVYPTYEIYKWGNYNEMLIPEIINLLEEKGRQKEADWLRAEWEKKAKYFIYDDPWPYASEFPTDRTHTESTYALAKYGATHDMKPDVNLWYDKNLKKWYSHPTVTREAALEFMERQHLSNLAIRGWLEPAYYSLGSALRDAERLCYMARMGGWSVLDYGILFADNPHDWLQLGYASYLSSFALMNTGTPETNYGFWYPGKANDGALGQAFTPFKQSNTWVGYVEERGPWRYDGEQNLGMGAVTRMAATILTEDPLFGWISYGGKLEVKNGNYAVIPKDGVRIRFWLIDNKQRVGIELDRDGFKKEYPIIVNKNRDRIEFVLENRTAKSHQTRLTIDVKGTEKWTLNLDGKVLQSRLLNGKAIFNIDVTAPEHKILLKKSK
jgi:hypothetical protein